MQTGDVHQVSAEVLPYIDGEGQDPLLRSDDLVQEKVTQAGTAVRKEEVGNKPLFPRFPADEPESYKEWIWLKCWMQI
jgi:hypothetical protein